MVVLFNAEAYKFPSQSINKSFKAVMDMVSAEMAELELATSDQIK